MLPFFVIL